MPQTMIRVEKKTNYVVMNKEALANPKLSWKAKGLLVYLLSLPDDWQIYVEELQSHSKDGRDSTISAMKELMEARYIHRAQQRSEHGKFGKYQYVVYEYPQSTENTGIPPKPENPETVNPNTDKPNTENPQLLSNNKLSNNINLEEEETTQGKNQSNEVIIKYQQCISKNISDLEIKLLSDLQSKTCKELVLKAIEIAVLKNGKNLGYISTLVNDWKGKELNTCADVDKYLAEWTTKNQKAKNNREKQVERRAENKDYSKKVSSFNDYEQRDYNFDELEKKLFGWDTEDSMP